jgi:phage FluMu protein Com
MDEKQLIEKYYEPLERRCTKCHRLLFIVQNYMAWANKLTIDVKCSRCGEMNHVVHHDFNKNAQYV